MCEPRRYFFERYYRPCRPSYMGRGMWRAYAVLPMAFIMLAHVTTIPSYFLFYFMWTRAEVQYGRWIPPLFRSMDLDKPKVLKARLTGDYINYKPLTKLRDILKAMDCEELRRKKCYDASIKQQNDAEELEACKCSKK